MDSPTSHHHCPKRETLSIRHARARVTHWREKVIDLFQQDPPRAIYIPIEDINALAEKFGKEKDIKGVRAYLGIEYPASGPVLGNPVRCVIVPVYQDCNNELRDLVEEYVDTETGNTVSTIYDFTTPCPDLCDDTSPLYVKNPD